MRTFSNTRSNSRMEKAASTCDNFIFLGDFNSCMEDSPMKTFDKIYKL